MNVEEGTEFPFPFSVKYKLLHDLLNCFLSCLCGDSCCVCAQVRPRTPQTLTQHIHWLELTKLEVKLPKPCLQFTFIVAKLIAKQYWGSSKFLSGSDC